MARVSPFGNENLRRLQLNFGKKIGGKVQGFGEKEKENCFKVDGHAPLKCQLRFFPPSSSGSMG